MIYITRGMQRPWREELDFGNLLLLLLAAPLSQHPDAHFFFPRYINSHTAVPYIITTPGLHCTSFLANAAV